MKTFFQRDAGVALLRKYMEEKIPVELIALFRESVVGQNQAMEGPLKRSGIITEIQQDEDDYLVSIKATGVGVTDDQRKINIERTFCTWVSIIFAVEIVRELKPNLVEVPKIGMGR